MNELAETAFLPPLALQPQPEPGRGHLLAVPSPEQTLRYALAYWPATLRSLLRPHRLDPAAAGRTYAAPFQPAADAHTRWCATLGLDDAAATGAPFLFSQATGTLLYMKLFGDLGLNFRHLLHLRHRATHRPVPTPALSSRQTVSARIAAVHALGARKAVVQVACTVSSDEGFVLLHVQDDFIVRGYRPGQLAALARHPAPPFEALQRPAPRWTADAPAPWQAAIEVAPDLGQRYGALSGDANPVHTRAWAARLFGHPRPFLQGLATRSLIVGHLAQAGWRVHRLDLHLCRPVPCGERVRLAHDGQRFELSDAEGHTLLACGRFEAAARG
jgi:acyl dehydratase